MSRYHYVKCLGDNSWLAKPAQARVFKRDIREAAPLTIEEAAALGFRADDPIYPLVLVDDVYPHAPPSYFSQALRLISEGPENFLPLGPDDREFGGVAFDPLGRAEDFDGDDNVPTNGERADAGKVALALSTYRPEEVIVAPSNHVTTALLALGVNLTEAPEDALTDLLTNLMHYCHREGIELYGDDGALPSAQRHFAAESGGAAL